MELQLRVLDLFRSVLKAAPSRLALALAYRGRPYRVTPPMTRSRGLRCGVHTYIMENLYVKTNAKHMYTYF